MLNKDSTPEMPWWDCCLCRRLAVKKKAAQCRKETWQGARLPAIFQSAQKGHFCLSLFQ